MGYPKFEEPESIKINTDMLVEPSTNGQSVELEKGPNIAPLPEFDPLPETVAGPVLLKVGDDISTDEIMPAGAKVLPYRSNIPEISKFVYHQVDENFYDRAMEHQKSGFFIVGGDNYGQGSSREHAAIAPRYLGLRVVLTKNFARIHWQNLVNFGILPLTFVNPEDWEKIEQGDTLELPNIAKEIQASGCCIDVVNKTKGQTYNAEHALSERQIEMIIQGSLINVIREKKKG